MSDLRPFIRQTLSALAVLLAATSVTLPSLSQTYATGDSRTVNMPTYPAVCMTLSAQFTTSQRSSPPASDDTTRLQSALTSCANTGKSVVLAASGSNNAFYSAELNVTGEGLVINSGVTLEGSNAYASQSELLYFTGTNSFLGGPGAVDGRGDILTGGKPRLVQTQGAVNFIAYNVTLQQAAYPNLYIEGGSGATVYDVTILTPASRANADGIDIDSITDVTVYNSSIEAGDDGIAVKTNHAAASNITIKNNKVYGTHGLSIGSQTFNGVTNVLFTGNYIYGDDHSGKPSTQANGIRIKTDEQCGGLVKQVTYQNTCMTQARYPIVITAYYGSCKGNPGTPQFQDIIINGVLSTSSLSGADSYIQGYSSSYLAQVYLANISLDTSKQGTNEYATVFLDNSSMTPTGTGVTTSSFTTTGSVPTCSF